MKKISDGRFSHLKRCEDRLRDLVELIEECGLLESRSSGAGTWSTPTSGRADCSSAILLQLTTSSIDHQTQTRRRVSMLALPAPSDCSQEQPCSSVDVPPQDDTPEVPPVETITQVQNLDDYFLLYGKALAHKVQETLDPLHVPDRDPLPDWKKAGLNIHLIEGQAHTVSGAVQAMDHERNIFINGETGTGKTYMACAAVHAHASRPRNQGGKNGLYIATVLCPDHLMDKWARHIQKAIPTAKVIRLEGTSRQAYQQLLQLKNRSYLDARGRRRWAKLNQPIWIVMGRNQSKFFPDAVGVGDLETPTGKLSHRKTAIATRKTWDYDEQKYIYKSDVVDTIRCPRCGKIPHSEQKKVYLESDIANKRRRCCNFIGVEVQDPKKPTEYRGDRIIPAMPSVESEYRKYVAYGDLVPGRKFEPGASKFGRKYRAEYCGEFLWQYSKEKLRWPPSMVMKKQLHGLLDYLVCDEAHEQKSGESVQSQAFGRLLGEAKHTICLTGTLIGGYAKDVFDLVTRMRPWAMTALGYEWGKVTPFTEAYGMRTLTVTQTIADSGKVDSERSMRSSRKRKRGGGSDTSENWTDRPGIMPRLFPDVLMPMACYLSLSDIMEGLPPLTEYVVENILDLPDDVLTEYRRLEAILTGNSAMAEKLAIFGDEAAAASIVNELRKKGAFRKIVGTMNTVLLKYVDRPWDWESYRPDAPEGKHSVGYFQDPSKFGKDESTWIGLTTPQSLGVDDRLLPKEERTIEICKANKEKGRKVWVYVTSSGNTDVRPRLREVLRKAGLEVGILQDSVPLQDREAWITKHTPKVDVMISHPQLVSTGLDLLDYPTLVFYELDWNMTLVWQASRRAWRIGQKQPCEVHYLTYRNTAQMHQLNIMAKKKAAALALNGKLSEEGLAAMAGDEMGAQMELAKMVGNQIDESDLMRKWGKMTYGNLEFASTTVESETVDPHSEGSTENPEESSEFDASEETGLSVDVFGDGYVEPAPEPEPEPEPVKVQPKRKRKARVMAAVAVAAGVSEDADDSNGFLSPSALQAIFQSVFGEDYQEPPDDEIW